MYSCMNLYWDVFEIAIAVYKEQQLLKVYDLVLLMFGSLSFSDRRMMRRGIWPSCCHDVFDRTVCCIPKSQIFFIDYFIMDMFEACDCKFVIC